MKLLIAFFRLIRWPNLVFIALTQFLFYSCIILPSLPATYFHQAHHLGYVLLVWLIFASILIAAAGYIINDYFDINIDQVNKPEKMVVEKLIRRRMAILLHLIISGIGLLVSAYVAYKSNWIVFAANALCALLLWVYSTTFKRQLLTGNVIISLLTAWTVFVLYFATNTALLHPRLQLPEVLPGLHRIFKFAALYGGFAFIISLIREVVKDIEDIRGDSRNHCRTMPIVWGIPAAKVFVGVWLVVLIGALLIVQFYAFLLGWNWIGVYGLLLVVAPLIYLLKVFYHSTTEAEYHRISTLVKLIMLAGILSIVFFRFYL